MAQENTPNPMRFVGMGLELAGAIAGMTLLGYGIDYWLGTTPWGMLIASMIGIVGGLYNVIKAANRANR